MSLTEQNGLLDTDIREVPEHSSSGSLLVLCCFLQPLCFAAICVCSPLRSGCAELVAVRGQKLAKLRHSLEGPGDCRHELPGSVEGSELLNALFSEWKAQTTSTTPTAMGILKKTRGSRTLNLKPLPLPEPSIQGLCVQHGSHRRMAIRSAVLGHRIVATPYCS